MDIWRQVGRGKSFQRFDHIRNVQVRCNLAEIGKQSSFEVDVRDQVTKARELHTAQLRELPEGGGLEERSGREMFGFLCRVIFGYVPSVD